MSNSFTCLVKSAPKIQSRSRSKKRGALSHGKLLRGPFCGRVSGHAEMQDSATVVSQHQEYVGYLKANGRHREEVDGHHGPDMILKGGSPGLRRLLPPTCHVLAHARFPDVDAQFEQFTMDTRRTPEWILAAHPANQLPNLFGHRWSSGLAPP